MNRWLPSIHPRHLHLLWVSILLSFFLSFSSFVFLCHMYLCLCRVNKGTNKSDQNFNYFYKGHTKYALVDWKPWLFISKMWLFCQVLWFDGVVETIPSKTLGELVTAFINIVFLPSLIKYLNSSVAYKVLLSKELSLFLATFFWFF